MKYDTHVPTSDYINCIFSHYFYPTINRPTRITDTSATLIDNILTNNNLTKYVSSILYADISDHLPVLLQTDLAPNRGRSDKFYFRRSFTDQAKSKFSQLLHSVNWDCYITDDMDPNVAFKTFNEIFLNIYDTSFPLNKVNITRTRNPRKPWMTAGLVRSCIKKEKLYKLRIKHPTSENITKYKSYRNKLIKILRAAEKNYYADKFELFKFNTKQTWQTVKHILHKRDITPLVDSFKINNTVTTDKITITNKFNEYFVNIGPTLANKIPDTADTYKKYLSGTYKASFSMYPATPDEIVNVVKLLHLKRSSGFDDVSVETLILSIPHIAMPITKIINKSLCTGIVPDDIKIATVCPTYKTGDQSEMNNCRPISVCLLYTSDAADE